MMELFFTTTLSLSRSAYRFRIPYPPRRRISTHPRPPFPITTPARRNFEYAKPKPEPERTARGSTSTPDRRRRPTNRQIPFDKVYLLDPSTHKLSPNTHSLSALLETHTQARRVIELVASYPTPIVRVTTRHEIEARYKELRRAAKRGSKVGEDSKEVQLSWGVGKADLEHKLRKAQRDLEKGYRVVVGVKMRKGLRPSSRQEAVAFADAISGTLGEVGEEWKEREVTDRSMVLSFRPKAELDS